MSNMFDLKKAYDEKRLGAVHIDLQRCYYRSFAKAAFPVANQFATAMRQGGVENLWVAETRNWKMNITLQFAMKHRNTPRDIHDSIEVAADEYIFEKAANGAFDDDRSLLATHLSGKGIDTLLMTGVMHNVCFSYSVAGALRKDFSVAAVIDATDCSPADFHSWSRSFFRSFGNKEGRNRLMLITAREAMDTLGLGA